MKIRLMIFAPLMLFSCISYGDETVDLDTPEGWAMAFMTSSALNLGQMPPQSVNIGDISISAEISSIPHLSKEQQKIEVEGYFKDEDLNKSPAFGRLRASVGLPWDINAEISWTPPIQINDSVPDHLWGAALSKPLFNNEKIGIGLRLFLLRGGAIASVTCSEDVIDSKVYTDENYVGCVGLSNDRLKMNHEGVEVFLSFNNSSVILPWVSLASSNIDGSVEIDAPLFAGRETSTIHSSGSIQTLSFGFNYDVGENRRLSVSSSYTPLEVQRADDSSDNDNFWNLRVGLIIGF
jgi:hypothetical protein